MRGKQRSTSSMRTDTRNIPAYAGKTFRGRVPRRAGTEHPRVCGENGLEELPEHHLAGTSPRMRGKHPCQSHPGPTCRNIPAYAGKTVPGLLADTENQEHPRVCGENNLMSVIDYTRGGTSPRMRGKLPAIGQTPLPAGNIPAYAGKTRAFPQNHSSSAEHSRVCGENPRCSACRS